MTTVTAKTVTLTIDGKPVAVPQGTLLIEAAKQAGIEVPSFCYYPGLALQGACRMCQGHRQCADDGHKAGRAGDDQQNASDPD